MPDTSLETFLKARSRGDEPLLGFKWVCTSLPYGLPVTYVESVQVSFVNFNIKDGLFAAATYSYFPGFTDIDSFTITFHESISAKATKWILYWKSRIKNFETGAYYLPSNYKEDIKLSLLNNRNESVIDITMVDVWPATNDQWDLNYTDPAARMQVSCTFSVDDQVIQINSNSYGSPGSTPASIFTADGIASPAPTKAIISSEDNNSFSGNTTPPSVPRIGNTGVNSVVNSAGVEVPLQNPQPSIPGAFEAPGNASQEAEAAEEPSFFSKMYNSTKDAVTNAGGQHKEGLVKLLKDEKPTSVQEVRDLVNGYKEDNQDTLVANVTAAPSRVIFDDLVKTPESEREGKIDENSSFLAEVGSSLRLNSEDYADSVIGSAESANPNDPIEIQNFAEFTADDNESWLENVQDDVTTSAETHYEKYKSDKEKAEAAEEEQSGGGN